ncbi:hypothetical protein SBADM41S_00451 [Streptomyces badius]
MSGPKAHAVRWDMRDRRNQETFTDAVKRTREDILQRQLIHDGHKVMRNHVINARRRTNAWGVTIGKEHRESARKIDLAICMIGARMLRRTVLNSPKNQKRTTARGRGRAGGVAMTLSIPELPLLHLSDDEMARERAARGHDA